MTMSDQTSKPSEQRTVVADPDAAQVEGPPAAPTAQVRPAAPRVRSGRQRLTAGA